jgi:hypothetical protein
MSIKVDPTVALSTLIALLTGLHDGTLTAERGAELLDDLVDTGSLDAVDDVVFHGFVVVLDALIPDHPIDLIALLELARDPVNMRARADRVEAHNPERAARIRKRAARVEGRRST